MLNFLLEISCTCKKNRYSYIKVCIEIVIIFTIGDYRSILELLDGFLFNQNWNRNEFRFCMKWSGNGNNFLAMAWIYRFFESSWNVSTLIQRNNYIETAQVYKLSVNVKYDWIVPCKLRKKSVNCNVMWGS